MSSTPHASQLRLTYSARAGERAKRKTLPRGKRSTSQSAASAASAAAPKIIDVSKKSGRMRA